MQGKSTMTPHIRERLLSKCVIIGLREQERIDEANLSIARAWHIEMLSRTIKYNALLTGLYEFKEKDRN